MKLLKTYLQVSDLHFVDPVQRLLYDPWARHVPLLSGFVGHAKAPLRYLQLAFRRLLYTNPKTDLIVTGDLTAYGATNQFKAADAYLGTAGTYPEFLGLNRPQWSALSVPGNHDFWPGIGFVSLGWTNREVGRRYPLNASITPSVTLANGQQVVFLHLNGDADVKSFSPERFYACGSFCSAIQALDRLMLGRSSTEIRVLLLHHSVQYSGSTVNRVGSRWLPASVRVTLRHLTIDDVSRAELTKFITKHGIRVILTGHVHHPYFIGNIATPGSGFGHAVLESCCGTTTQRPVGLAGPTAQNSLVIHRMEEDDNGDVYWRSEVHTLALSKKGFSPPSVPAPPNSGFSIRVSP